MEQERIKSISEKLELKREIVGIRFLVYEQDYDACSAEQAGIKTRLCGFVNRATHGKRTKVVSENFTCSSGPELTGMREESERMHSGQLMSHCGLYSDLGIAREVCKNTMPIPQKIYGLEIGPLAEMEEADVVIIIGMAEQIMHIVEGYTYHYGVPQPFISVGNCAMCSDMTSKPFMRNDLNLSLMCCGARTSTVSDFGELGVGMPAHMFRYVADGVMKLIHHATSE